VSALHAINALNEYKMLSLVATLAIARTNGMEVTVVSGVDLVIPNASEDVLVQNLHNAMPVKITL